jgi:hypothetical protein
MKRNIMSKATIVAMLAVASSLSPQSTQNQQADSHATVGRATSAAVSAGPSRGNFSGGGSSWTAGKGSLLPGEQSGGIWRAGAAYNPASTANRGVASNRSLTPNTATGSVGSSTGLSTAKPTGTRANPLGNSASRTMPGGNNVKGVRGAGSGLLTSQNPQARRGITGRSGRRPRAASSAARSMQHPLNGSRSSRGSASEPRENGAKSPKF